MKHGLDIRNTSPSVTSSHDPKEIKKQIDQAKGMGISAFVVDWYGDREPFIDQSYALIQKLAAKNSFHVAMMYDETEADVGATDEAIADFTMFHDAYLSAKSPGHKAYLTYQGRPVIFIFPKGGHTDWSKVRALVNTWRPVPFLIDENLPGKYADAFDGFYAWISPGTEGWRPDGSNWGKEYLSQFYETMRDKYPDKLIVGGAWAEFNDSKASWGLDRHISARCGQTFSDTFNFWRHEFPPADPIPFIMIETWNDYEEGTAIERGVPGLRRFHAGRLRRHTCQRPGQHCKGNQRRGRASHIPSLTLDSYPAHSRIATCCTPAFEPSEAAHATRYPSLQPSEAGALTYAALIPVWPSPPSG